MRTHITCCRDYTDRHIGCHSTCEAYIGQRAELDASNAAKQKDKQLRQTLNDIRRDGVERSIKHR